MSGEIACRPAPASTESAGPGNCANPATTDARTRKADRMDVTLRFSYEPAGKIQRALWGRLLICGRLAIGPLTSPRQAAAVANRRAGCQPAPQFYCDGSGLSFL